MTTHFACLAAGTVAGPRGVISSLWSECGGGKGGVSVSQGQAVCPGNFHHEHQPQSAQTGPKWKESCVAKEISLIKVCFNSSDLCNHAEEWRGLTHSQFLLLGQLDWRYGSHALPEGSGHPRLGSALAGPGPWSLTALLWMFRVSECMFIRVTFWNILQKEICLFICGPLRGQNLSVLVLL